MKALITGASSGIGRDMARVLASKGYDLILVARHEEKLLELKKEFSQVNVKVITADLSSVAECQQLYLETKNDDIDVLINNAGFGLFGAFDKTDLNVEQEMISTNIMAVTTLMKLYLQSFQEKNSGHILNVASAAAFMTGPLMAVYYATKSYVYKLSLATYEELRRQKSHVHISVLCPGPIKTGFQKRADVRFTLKAQSSEKVAAIAIKMMLKGKLIIIPSKLIAFGKFLSRFTSEKALARIGYSFQKRKDG